MTNQTKLYRISNWFAKTNKLPIYFVAITLNETNKAVQLYGRGTTETARLGVCMKCGAALTHPVSKVLGIGPVCGGHYHDWNKLGGYDLANIEILKKEMRKIEFTNWFPKSVIVEVLDTEDIIKQTDIPLEVLGQRKMKRNRPIKQPKQVRQLNTSQIKLKFVYNPETVQQVKTLSGRRYDPDSKTWTADLSIDNVNHLLEWGFVLRGEELSKWYEQYSIDYTDTDSETVGKPLEIKGLQGTLRPFQAAGVRFIESRNGRALIADEMGLGKTIQTIAWLQHNPTIRPVLLIVPASLKLNWEQEINTWMSNTTVQVLSGTKPTELTANIAIINYDIVKAWEKTLFSAGFKALILDEAHYIKNNTAKRTGVVKRLSKHIPNIIALTGTPIVNRPIEMYNVINIINPSLFPNRFAYAKQYCDAKHNGFGWDFNGASNTAELHQKLTSSIMLRRKKIDVLKELPAKQYSLIPFTIDNMKDYKFAEDDFLTYIKETKGTQAALRASSAEVLASIEALKQLAVAGKMNGVINWVRDFLESGEKLVIMATHKIVIDTLMQEFNDIAVKVDGSTIQQARHSAVQLFQDNDKIRLFVGNIKAAGVGLTLTAASSVAILEFPWTPGDLHQAIDRVHRIGQVNAVNVYYLVARDTIDEKIAKMLDKKVKIIDTIMDGGHTEDSTLFEDLLNELV